MRTYPDNKMLKLKYVFYKLCAFPCVGTRAIQVRSYVIWLNLNLKKVDKNQSRPKDLINSKN